MSWPSTSWRSFKDVDARHKAGHDGCGFCCAFATAYSLRRLALRGRLVRGGRLLLDDAHREDRQLVEPHERDGERELAQHVRRREDRRDHEGTDDEIAAL